MILSDEFTSEQSPSFTLDRDAALARREMGEARWATLSAEWIATERALHAAEDRFRTAMTGPRTKAQIEKAKARYRAERRQIIEGNLV